MKAFQNIGIKDYFKRYGLSNGLKRGAFIICPLQVVKDKSYRKILYYYKIKNYLRRKCIRWRDKEPIGIEYGCEHIDDRIWIYWKQGIENAPAIVKSCIYSVIKIYDKKVILLSDQNINSYISLPSYVDIAVEQGSLSVIMYSDILRFSLLEHYGGTWIDATVFLTAPLPNYIVKSDLFAYRDSCASVYNPALMSVWLIRCRPGCEEIKEVRNVLLEYCRRKKKTIEYLFTSIIFTSVLEDHEEALDNIPYANSDYSYLLLDKLGNKYDPDLEEHIKELSSVHKLSYKLNDRIYDEKDTFYEIVISNNPTHPNE